MRVLLTSIYSQELYVLKSRLSFEGITSYLWNENLIAVNPLYSVALGGATLVVSDNDYETATMLIIKFEEEIDQGEIDSYLSKSIEELQFRYWLRTNPQNIGKSQNEIDFKFEQLEQVEIAEVIDKELHYDKSKFKERLTWNSFWVELFDGSLFRFIKKWETNYYLENDLIELIRKEGKVKEKTFVCEECGSENVAFGYTYVLSQSIILFILSVIIVRYHLPAFKKRYHCFDCGHEFL